jgi:hypothetical protein
MPAMKLLIQSAMIFFGTLMAAALVALGEPTRAGERPLRSDAGAVQNQLPQSARPWMEQATPVFVPPLIRWDE